MGTAHGWALAQGGEEVWHVLRGPDRAEASRSVTIDLYDLRQRGRRRGPHDVTYSASVTRQVRPEDRFELVVVATKHTEAAEAVRAYRDVAPDAIFLLFTANWAGAQEIDALLPRSRYVWGYPASDGGWAGDRRLMLNLRPEIRLGALPGNSPTFLSQVRSLFERVGLRPSMKEDILEWLWVHHAINAGTIGGALHAGGIVQLTRSLQGMAETMAAVREALNVVAARGVDLKRYPDAAPYTRWPAWLVPMFALAFRYRILHTTYGKRTVASGHFATNREEMKQFVLDVLLTARQLRVGAPHLEAIGTDLQLLVGA